MKRFQTIMTDGDITVIIQPSKICGDEHHCILVGPFNHEVTTHDNETAALAQADKLWFDEYNFMGDGKVDLPELFRTKIKEFRNEL